MMQRKLKHIYRFISVFFIWFALMVIIRWSIQNSNVPNHMFQCNHVSWPFKPNSINRYIARFANIHIFWKIHLRSMSPKYRRISRNAAVWTWSNWFHHVLANHWCDWAILVWKWDCPPIDTTWWMPIRCLVAHCFAENQ